MAESRFVYVTYIRTTPEKLWRALTDPESTRRYWCATRHESEWTVGSPWKIMIPDGRVADSGEILEIVPNRRLVLTWKNQFSAELKDELPTRVTYEIETQGESVKLTLIHEADEPDSKTVGMLSQGWPAILSSLKSFLETGEPLAETRRWPEGM